MAPVPAPLPAPKPTRYEALSVSARPTSDGIPYEIINVEDRTYTIILTHRVCENVFGIKTSTRHGVIPVTDVAIKRGEWTSFLICDNEIIHTSTFELDLGIEWLARELGGVDIRYADTDGVLDRLGCIAIRPGPPGDTPHFSPSVEDFCIAVIWPELPDDFDTGGTEFTFEVHRPGDRGIYYTEKGGISRLSGYRVIVNGHFPATESGGWEVRVLLGSRVLGRSTFYINRGGPANAVNNEIAVEEFGISLVNG